MLIQKSLHVNRSLDDTKDRLLGVPLALGPWNDVESVDVDGRRTQVEFQAGLGFVVRTSVEELPSDNPNEILFHSCEGNVTFVGMIEFTPIKDRLTEVTLTLDYAVGSPLHAFMNRVTGAIDRFLNQQLSNIQSSLNGPAAGPNVRTAPAKASRERAPVYRVPSPALSICLR